MTNVQPPVEFGGHRRFAAFWDWTVRHEGKQERAMRRKAAASVRGRILELGVGVGANWPYLPGGVEYVGIEPDPYMLQRARSHEAKAGGDMRLEQARAEALPFEDESFDSVLVTLTLCTVEDPARALSEARRVLKRDGVLTFFEHVRPEGRVQGRLMDMVTPLWRRIGAGCHPNRNTVAAIRDAGFEVENVVQRRINGLPMVVGSARTSA